MNNIAGLPVRGEYLASRAYICIACGTQFARVDLGTEWVPWRGVCESCTYPGGWIPGSLVLGNRADASLPLAAWQREVELHCRWAQAEGI